LTLPGRPVHPCGLSLGSMCESRLLPLAKDTCVHFPDGQSPCKDLPSPLGGSPLVQLLWRGLSPRGPRRKPLHPAPALHRDSPRRPHAQAASLSAPQVARWEHKTRKLSRAFGSPHLACYTLGGAILLLNSLDNPLAYRVGLALLGVGGVFVLSSFLALGFTGTFLGDYFGILKEARVTTFPFSILDNPMYWGSTANYLGWAIMHASPAGLLLTTVVALIYTVAILYEEPFTAEIYRQKASQAHKRS
ncbi:hypothetical protein E2I00_011475, partial [Balaenoptera physalus]